jgi:hypothetical protein
MMMNAKILTGMFGSGLRMRLRLPPLRLPPLRLANAAWCWASHRRHYHRLAALCHRHRSANAA